jgi:hypothetical protein
MPTIGNPEETDSASSADTSESQMLNDALGMAGGCDPISSIDDGSTNANHCLVFYGPLRDSLLRMHFWNFALVWVELAQVTGLPAIGYAYVYRLPGDWLRAKDYAGNNPGSVVSVPAILDPSVIRVLPNYKIEGRYLRTNDGQAWHQYVRRVTNPAEWDALFYQVMVMWLASKLALAIRRDVKMSSGLLQQVNTIMLPLALAVDGQEGSVEPYVSDNLLWGRR